MNNVFRGIKNICLVYLDDITFYSTSLEEHILRFKQVSDRLRSANFKTQLDKTEFLRKEVAYLADGVKPNPKKVSN